MVLVAAAAGLGLGRRVRWTSRPPPSPPGTWADLALPAGVSRPRLLTGALAVLAAAALAVWGIGVSRGFL